MRRSTPILAVFLGASVLGNVLWIARGSRAPEAAAPAPPRLSALSEGQESVAALRERLDAEKKKNEELRARVERLETDKKVLVQEPAPGAGKPDKIAAFREKLRKLRKMMKDPAAKAGAVDPDSMVELSDAMMEFFKLSAMRSKDPKTYSEYLQTYYEVALEGGPTALSADQSAALSKLFEDYGIALSKIPASPAGDRLLKEIELEAGVMGRVQDLLSGPQREQMQKDELNAMATGSMLTTAYVTKQGGADQIAKMWTSLYQLDASQEPQARVAAQAFLDAMDRVDAENKDGKQLKWDKSGSPESYAYRLRAVREQIAALNMLAGSMTPAQQDRLQTQSFREFLIFEGTVQHVDAAAPAEK
jgi:hypothetical protein